MTRFELAGILSNRLYMLTDSEKHNIIDKYVTEINMKVEEGMDEAQAVARLGDIELLADRILARHHIDTSRIPQQPAEEFPEEAEEKISAAETDVKVGEMAKGAAEKIGDTVKSTAEKSGTAAKKAADSIGRFAKWLGKGAVNLTFTLTNLLIFIIIWLPSMALTALTVICTVAAVVIHLFTGIGFWGVDIAGAGCCLVGISFCLWLGNTMTGGKKNG